jgi:uncharacterized protein
MRHFALAFLLIWGFLPGVAVSEPYPAPEDLYVNDLAEVISPEVEDRLRGELERLKAETGIEMTVLTLSSRAEFDASSSVEDFATRLFNGWGIGDADRNDGILALVLTDDREMRLELGSGYNQGFDPLAQDLINRYFKPAFIEGDYSAGIEKGTLETITRIAKRHAENLQPEALQDTGRKISNGRLMIVAFAAVIGFIAVRRRIGDIWLRFRNCPQCGRRGLHRHRQPPKATSTDATGLSVTECRNCDYHDEREYRVSRGSRSGSSRGSFGGGRSSGGGASGRW